jgi:hypothetical protein
MKGRSVLGLWACGLVSIGSANGEVTGTVTQQPVRLFVSPELRAALDEAQGLRQRRDDARAGPLLEFVEVDIEPQAMGEALIKWAEQTDLNLIADEMVDGLKLTHRVKGKMTAIESLKLLLSGSGLQYEFATPRLVVVKEKDPNRFVPPVPRAEDE